MVVSQTVTSKRKLVSLTSQHYTQSTYRSPTFIYEDLTGRKQAIDSCLQEVKSYVEETEDVDTLDRVFSLLTQASAALKCDCHETTETPQSFEVRESFAPTQKNEVQLRLWRTANLQGRKRQKNPMKSVLAILDYNCCETIILYPL